MGWHYILRAKCKLHPEFIPFIKNKYLETQFDRDNDTYYRTTISPVSYNYGHLGASDRNSCNEEEWLAKEALEKELQEEQEREEENRHNEYESLSPSYKTFIDIWIELNIGIHFYKYNLTDDIFSFEISKKVTWHEGDLYRAYIIFLHDITAPISEEIIECEIESDDCGDFIHTYSDADIRNDYLYSSYKNR